MPADFKQDVGTAIQYVGSLTKGGNPVDPSTVPNVVFDWTTDRPDVVTFDDPTIINPDITLTGAIDDANPASIMFTAQSGTFSSHSVVHTFSTNVVAEDPIDSVDFAPLVPTPTLRRPVTAGKMPSVFAKAGKILRR